MKKKFSSQKKILKHLAKGNTSAYSYIIELYYKSLCDYATNLARDNFKSEDIVQNVFIKMWENRSKLNRDISIKNYLYKSVYNEFIDQYRKDIAVSNLEKKYIEGIENLVETPNIENNNRLINIVKQEIEKLPKKCKETFLLSKMEGLTYIEIAEYQKVSVNTVEKQMVKAFSLIRKQIKEKMSTILFLLFKRV